VTDDATGAGTRASEGRPGGRFRRALALAAASLVLVAGLGGVALWRFVEDLGPLDLSRLDQGSTVVLDRDGRLLRAFTTEDGRWRLPATTGDVDPRFLAALQSFEDRRFMSHRGVDPLALLRAAGQALVHGRIVSGGSTLTMQVARLLEPREERSLGAKLRQAVRAVQLERRFDKATILGFYLALAPYGGNVEGLRAAALTYFGKEPKRLTLAEAALLVALPQAPESRRPDRFAPAARAARDRVLARLVAHGTAAGPEAALAREEGVPVSRRAVPMLAAHAAEAAVRAAPGQRLHRLTIDARLQSSLEALLRERVAPLGPRISAGALVVDNATGAILAHVGGVDYLSPERAGSVDMASAVRSPGSALKPFIYALAFDEGIAHPETILDDRPSRFGLYAPENFDLAYEGNVTARRALQLSLNVPAVELLSEVGPSRFLARLRNAGADVIVPPEAPPGLAVALGGLGIRLTDLTRLYAGFARGGDVPTLSRTLSEQAHEASAGGIHPRISEAVSAWYVFDVLRGSPPPANALPGRIAYKTGTSYGYRDAWAVGFDRRVTIGVWIGRPDGSAVPGLIGRQVAAPVLFDAFARLGGEPEPLPMPPNALLASSATLPPPLRRLHKDAPRATAAAATPSLKIAFPPDGARVDLGFTLKEPQPSSLVLKAQGGVPPLRWLVNGTPLDAPETRRQSAWTPDGAGFARVTVIDGLGATDSVTVRVE
jgi:penicillin-binding protein 1C